MEYIETKKSKYIINRTFGLLLNSEVKDDCAAIQNPEINEDELIKVLKKAPTDEEIMEHLSSCTCLVLGVSNDCNFRCKYCIFSGKYAGERIHNDEKMNMEIAKKAVDLFMYSLMRDTRKKKKRDIYIGFFGGEPLLEFNLIKDVIEYVEKKALEIEFQKRYHIVYRLTTNGYLLKDEFVEFFKSKDCLLDVSLDGPKEEHDKFRVTRNGQKTWNRIMYNLQKIKKRYPEYYEKNVSYIATIHPHHNGKAIDGFFINNRDLFNEEKVRINNVDIERLKENERKFFIKKFETKSELELRQAMDQLGLKFNFKTIQANSSFTGTCFPGSEKFFVSSSGELNICEKASELCPKIGHVNTGFDFDGIRKILRDYNEKIIENRCWECEQWFLCGVCIINAFINGRFEFNCSIKKSYSYLLKQYIERREDDEKKYSYSINSNNNSIVDFIEQL